MNFDRLPGLAVLGVSVADPLLGVVYLVDRELLDDECRRGTLFSSTT